MAAWLVFALSPVFAQVNAPEQPAADWQTDYSTAIRLAEAAKKPLAVVIAKGENGWDSLASEGKLNGQALRTLRESYVCLYLDTDAAAGKDAAKLFSPSNHPTLVLSDRSLVYQAYRNGGAMKNDQLAQVLNRFATHEGPPPREERRYYSPPPDTTVIPCRT